MESIIISNSYTQTPKEFAGLYWKEILTRFWFLPVIFGGVILINVAKGLAKGSLLSPLLPLIIFPLVIIYGRYRFLSSIKKNPALLRSRIITVFSNRLEVEDEIGSKSVFLFTDLAQVKTLKNDYRVRLKTKQVFWVPKSCFKNESDRSEFERIVRVG